MYSPCWPPADSGGHASEPRRPGAPVSACNVNSVAGRSDHSLPSPKGVMAVIVTFGAAAWARSRGTTAPGAHTMASTAAAHAESSSTSAGSSGSPTTLACPPANHENSAPVSPGGTAAGGAAQRRSGWPPGGSARTTSTPPAASKYAQYAPASVVVRSRTRNGRSAGVIATLIVADRPRPPVDAGCYRPPGRGDGGSSHG